MAKAGAIPKFVNLLKSPSTNVAEQSVWALGNIAGDGALTRDLVLNLNAAEVLIEILQIHQPVSAYYYMLSSGSNFKIWIFEIYFNILFAMLLAALILA